jgi:hypothetical protein
MAVRMVAHVQGQDFQITLSRDDAGNYVADGARLSGGANGSGELPRVRVIDSEKERALHSLYESLRRLATSDAADGPDAPAAA